MRPWRRWLAAQHLRAALLLVSVALGLTACGGGGGGGAAPAPAPSNRAPALGSIGDQTVDEGSSTVLSVSAADPDGDALTFEAQPRPDFVAVENAGAGSWRLTVEPNFDDGGDYAITLRVVDADGAADEETFTLRIVNVNRAPSLATIDDVATFEGQSQTLVLTASDPDGDAVTFSGEGFPAFVAITDNGDGSASLSLEPGYFASGVYTVNVQVADSGALTDDAAFVVTVNDVNRAPLLTPIAAVALGEGELLQVPLSAIDPDGDSVALTVSGLPPFAGATDNGDGTGILNLAPGFFDSGTYPVTVRATDDGSFIDELGFVITVSDVNRPPVLSAVADVTLGEDETLSIPLTATDPDGDSVALSVIGLPPFATLTDNGDGTGSLDLQPGFADSGLYPLRIQVTDSGSAVTALDVPVTVTNVNRDPSWAPVPDQMLAEDETLVVAVSASDPDDDNLVLSGVGLPPFVSLIDNGDGTGTLGVQPGFADSGIHPVTLEVTDALAASDELSFVITVSDVNRPPVLSAVADVTLGEDETLGIPLTATDPDGDSVALSVVDLPPFATLTDNGDGTGTLDIQPGFTDSGSYAVTLQVTDALAAIDELGFVITVSDVNRPPVLSAVADVTLGEDETLSIPLTATDPDGDSVALSVIGLPPFATLTDNGDGTGSLDLQPGFADSGLHPLTIRATDGGSAVTESDVLVTVTNVNRDPSWAPVPDQALSEGETLVVALNASDPDEDNLVLSGVDLPAFVNLIDNGDGSGRLDLQPGFSDSGIYPVTLQVTDALAAVEEIGFYVTVGDVNQPPELSKFPIPGWGTLEGYRASYPFDAIDPDGDDITLAADGLPSFITLIDEGGGHGLLEIEPQFFDAGVYTFVIRATDTGFPSLTDEATVQFRVDVDGANQVARENSLPGTTDWHLDDPALAREIEGYASAASVNRGETISLYVNTLAPAFTLEVFRTGWYQGMGARRVHGPTVLPGTPQIIPTPDPITGLVEANWVNPYELETRDAGGEPWMTGVYLARLTESVGGTQSYIIFVVREDFEHHDVLFQLPVTTYQAYNAWGGRSLYDFNSGDAEPWGSTSGTRASHVSFDRPYARNPYDPAGYGMGAGEYLTNVQPVGRIDGAGWDYNMVRWLEYEQYDVAYITNIDTHHARYTVYDTEVFLSQGHDEYWTWEMRDNVEWARDHGVDLAFFASNAAYYQIRLEPSPTTAAPDRVVVAYKDALLDPVSTDATPLNDHLTTVPFRYLPVPRPEETLIGVQYVLDPYDGDIIVTNPTHWVFAQTGLVFGSRLSGLLGYEPDGMFGGGPSNLEVLAETPIVSSQDPTETGTSHMTVYTTESASVFATGSLQWSWGLDDYNAPQMRTSRLSAAAQQITGNVLEAFGALPRGGYPVEARCVRIISLSDAADDFTMAAAELDFLDADGYAIPKTGWSLAYVDSEETFWMDGAAVNAFDGDPATFWQTEWYPVEPAAHPHEIQIDLVGTFEISAVRYLPRQDFSLDGTVTEYEVYTSPDCASWSPVAAGTWEGNSGRKLARFTSPD